MYNLPNLSQSNYEVRSSNETGRAALEMTPLPASVTCNTRPNPGRKAVPYILNNPL
jgi:hypothetical protein